MPAAASSSDEPTLPPSSLLRFMQAFVRFSVDDMTATLKEHGLSMPQLGTLHLLGAEGPQSVSRIAEHLNLSLTATSHLVDRLVQGGLLHRREDPQDRRQKRITLSAEGRALVAAVQARSAASLDALLARVPAAKRSALERAMDEVVAELEAVEAKPGGPR